MYLAKNSLETFSTEKASSISDSFLSFISESLKNLSAGVLQDSVSPST
ncbi:MAG: hypothetical protein H7263_03150 [Candidatus Sericytochromatia bacterium]|nr:hypothetical protein [Candidatus Sericytochromatia bacterium]